MILADANLLLYAYHSGCPEHTAARTWLEERFSSPEPFALCWQTISAFLRLTTNRTVFSFPFSIGEATEIVARWLERPMVVLLEPGARYWSIARPLLEESNVRGALVPDALLAALAIEHGATLATHDLDFRRFPALRTLDPIVT
ncbi:MAG: TA system VapC family ribonuclease toxin [Thermoanaerobaculia bacterium]